MDIKAQISWPPLTYAFDSVSYWSYLTEALQKIQAVGTTIDEIRQQFIKNRVNNDYI